MNQQLYRATGRILDKMTPEELARYANRLCDQQAKAQNEGEITSKESSKEMAMFAGRQIQPLSTSEYIRFIQEMIKDADITNARRLTLAHLHILDLKISVLELGIAYTELLEKSLKEATRHSTGPKNSEDINKDMVQEILKKAKQILEQINQLKKEKEALLSYHGWELFGGILDVDERVSFLTPELDIKYRTESMKGGQPTRLG